MSIYVFPFVILMKTEEYREASKKEQSPHNLLEDHKGAFSKVKKVTAKTVLMVNFWENNGKGSPWDIFKMLNENVHFETIDRHAHMILPFNSMYSPTAFNPHLNKK